MRVRSSKSACEVLHGHSSEACEACEAGSYGAVAASVFDVATHLSSCQTTQLVSFLGDACLPLGEGDVPPNFVVDILDLNLAPTVAAALLARRLASRTSLVVVVVVILSSIRVVGENLHSGRRCGAHNGRDLAGHAGGGAGVGGCSWLRLDGRGRLRHGR